MPISRALISVSDKRGLTELGRTLVQRGIEIISTGGTARALREAGLAVTTIELVTNYPEMLGGRVKTLHPMIHGGLLARRDRPEDQADLERHGIVTIDLVVVNLYPFEATVSLPGVAVTEAIEQIDIGGVALLRAAAKNFEAVTVVSDPDDYPEIIRQLQAGREVDEPTRRRLAVKAFQQTARYDRLIGDWLADHLLPPAGEPERFPAQIDLHLERATILRYGENPHQSGALYRRPGAGGLAHAEQLHGKGMSFTNWLDADAAWSAVRAFERPAVVIVKHATPCGIAESDDLVTAYRWALASDPVSAFGGIVAANRPLALAAAEALDGIFTEVVLAPDFTSEALEFLRHKANRRLLRVPALTDPAEIEFRSLPGGLIAQDRDAVEHEIAMRVVTERPPTAEERAALAFAWRCVQPVKSNAIVLAAAREPGGFATVGIGTGQPNRVDAVRPPRARAGEAARGSVLAGDAFFPFADGVEAAAEAGVTAIIQPGGSVRDNEGIASANRHGIAMVFTGVRHFRH
ncbi:MAG: bifunctional phosphoribosylaminoimidazolecarboxamide formyltransferase/IMP cyclohydrolase [Ardenticatenaceae bacterium]|nr:bifunctional phosphoribosylaminoimidazolecarboxamide formyltransferase/IMP cyclohydrolase [Ardenticatenaceae bacterium]